LLVVENINTFYWERQVLWNFSLEVPAGSVVAMLGRNGMGKSTTIRSIMGLTPPLSGEVRFRGERINGLEPYQIARKGIALVPQGRCVFPSLTVRENLTVAERDTKSDGSWNLERIFDLFPILKQREGFHANLLSGGEQQMLAVARALMINPDLLVMDEPSEGLAPMVIKQISQVICQLKGKLTVLLAEQNLNMALAVADHIYVISKGAVVYESSPEELRNNEEMKQKWLGV
jgi:branched-chain amino acid transport system ATP-binding protein